MSRWPIRYAPWMVRDLVRGPGALMLAILGFAAVLVHRTAPLRAPPAGGERVLAEILGGVAWPFAILAAGGIVSGDRARGYYRVLFSRPVSPVAYYLQRWLLGGALVGLAAPVLGLGLWPSFGVVPFSWETLARLGLLYLLLGGLVLFCSAATSTPHRELVAVALVVVLQGVLHGMIENGLLASPLWRAVAGALPPFHHLGGDRRLPTGGELAHVALYGLTLVGGGLALVRLRPLGAGGRA
ncbi:MAG TPA: hypothetical protein VNK43_00525 [Gemmatimonadales bacterium]|nr:hypothetical protein [Gemmatimonadales bacterium]